MSCIVEYLKNENITEDQKILLTKKHNEIWEELINSKLFKKLDGKYYLAKFGDNVAKGIAKIGQINEKLGAKIVNRSISDRRIIVNVKPLIVPDDLFGTAEKQTQRPNLVKYNLEDKKIELPDEEKSEQLRLEQDEKDLNNEGELINNKPTSVQKEPKLSETNDLSVLAQELTQNLVQDFTPKPKVVEEVKTDSPKSLNKKQSNVNTSIKNLLDSLGISVKKADVIYKKQQEINTLYAKLDITKNETEKEKIQAEIKKLESEGIKYDTLAIADTLNRIINITETEEDDLSQMLFNEEVLHFIVDIIEQKNPELYKELSNKVTSYNRYKQILDVYSKDANYQLEDGKPNLYKIRKEAIAKVLNDYLNNEDFIEEEHRIAKTENTLDKILKALKSIFSPNNFYKDSFKDTIETILKDKSFINKDDLKYLSGEQYSGIVETIAIGAGVTTLLTGGVRFKSWINKSKEKEYVFAQEATTEEKIQNLLEKKKLFGKIKQNDEELYTFNGVTVLKRVSHFVKSYLNRIFSNVVAVNNTILELAAEDGNVIHTFFELTFEKYVDPKTGKLRPTPINASQKLKDLNDNYPISATEAALGVKDISEQVDKVVRDLIEKHKDSTFLTEMPLVSADQTYAGTLDLLIIDNKTGKAHVYDWKSKKGEIYGGKKRTSIPKWNIKSWRIQLNKYQQLLKQHGFLDFGKARAIPIMRFDKFDSIQKVARMHRIEIGSIKEEEVELSERQLLSVPLESEKTGFKATDKLLSRIYGLVAKLDNDYYNKINTSDKKDKIKLESELLHDIAINVQVTQSLASLKDKLFRVLVIHDDLIVKNENGLITKDDVIPTLQAIKELQIYEILPIVVKELYNEKEKSLTENEKVLKKELNSLSVDLNNKIKDLIEVYIKATNLWASEDYDLSDLDKKETEVESLGGINNNTLKSLQSVYQLNYKTGQLLGRLIMKGDAEIEEERVKIQSAFNKVRNKFLKFDFKKDAERFKIFLKYPIDEKTGKPNLKGIPKLVDKISPKYYESFKTIKEDFDAVFIATKGDFKNMLKLPKYKKYTDWLEENIKMEDWRKSYEDRKIQQKKNIDDSLSHLIDIDEKNNEAARKLETWILFNDITASASAFKLDAIRNFLKEDLWYSEEYEKIKDDADILEMYNLFRDVAIRAKNSGYSKYIYNIPTKVSTIEKLKFRSSQIKELGVIPFMKSFFIANQLIDQETQGFQKIDPITEQEEYKIPIYGMEEILYGNNEEKFVKDLDLLSVYQDLANKVIEYEVKSAIEDYIDAVIAVETFKDVELATNQYGNIGDEKKVENNVRVKILKDIKNYYLYNKRLEKDKVIFGLVSINKFASSVKNYTAALYLSANPAIAAIAKLGSSLSALQVAGVTYNKTDFLKSSLPISSAFGVGLVAASTGGTVIGGLVAVGIYKAMQMYMNNPNANIIKNSFSYHVNSSTVEKLQKNNSNKIKQAAVLSNEYLLNTLSIVDISVQDDIFNASLHSHAVVNNKIVNITEYVSNKFPDRFSNNTSNEERQEINKKMKQEIKDLKKQSLYNFLDKEAKSQKENEKYLSSVNLSTLDQKSIKDFTNRLQGESKKVLGNMSQVDYYSGLLGIISSLSLQFKTWSIETIASRWRDLNYNSQLKRHEMGRYRVATDFVLNHNDSFVNFLMGSVARFMHLVLPFQGMREDQVLPIIKAKYSQYINSSKAKNKEFISEKDFVETYLREISSASVSLYTTLLLVSLLSAISGDDPDRSEDDLWWYFYKKVVKGALRELTFSSDPKQLITMIVAPPMFGALVELFQATVNLPNSDAKIKEITDAIPVVRQIMRVTAMKNEDFADFLNVDGRYRVKEKKKPETMSERIEEAFEY